MLSHAKNTLNGTMTLQIIVAQILLKHHLYDICFRTVA